LKDLDTQLRILWMAHYPNSHLDLGQTSEARPGK